MVLLRSTRQNGTCRFPSSHHNFSEANFLDPGGSPRLRSGRLTRLPSRALAAPASVSVATAPRKTAAPCAAERGSPPRRRCTGRCGVRWLPRGAGPSRRCTVSIPRPPGVVPSRCPCVISPLRRFLLASGLWGVSCCGYCAHSLCCLRTLEEINAVRRGFQRGRPAPSSGSSARHGYDRCCPRGNGPAWTRETRR